MISSPVEEPPPTSTLTTTLDVFVLELMMGLQLVEGPGAATVGAAA
jgi:hypothetical protein